MNFKGWSLPILRGFCILATISACILISSCGSSSKSLELAKQNVEQFHSQLDTAQYAAIYASCDEKFHAVTSEFDFAKLLEAVHRKLGFVRQSNVRNTGFSWYAGQGAVVTLVYDTTFTEGSGTEKFVWHIKDDTATLYSYNIRSNDLVTR
jgi:hypothetical protein